MVPILTAGQIGAADRQTIARGAISSLELMERAAARCANLIMQLYADGRLGVKDKSRFIVIAGPGNNGGDAYAVARLLLAAGMPVRVVKASPARSADAVTNEQRLIEMGVRLEHVDQGAELQFGPDDVLVDGLFGTGLDRPLEGHFAALVRQINASGAQVVAIDMPSGLFAEDNSMNDPTAIVRADHTLTFEVPKLSQLLAENAPFTGLCHVLPIGLDQDFIHSLPTDHFLVREKDIANLLPPRPREGHKGTFGHALLIGGSYGKAGAAALATMAALRSGAGLVTSHLPRTAVPIVQTLAPEAMCSADPQEHLSELPDLSPYTSIGIGPGIGMHDDTARMFKRLIQDASSSLVVDADALNLLAENRTWLSFLPQASILTPHPKEFDRLCGSPASNDHERLQRAREFARKYGHILVLKGAHTAICDPLGKVYFNSTGGPGMAKGGSGDALTGLLTGLLAQRMAPLKAALLGVHLHGSAGDLAAMHKGMDAMTISELISIIPEAWERLRNASEEIVDGALSFAQDPGFIL